MDRSNPAPVTLWEAGSTSTRNVALLGEEPLSIRVEGKPYAVVMRTPGDEIAHAAGNQVAFTLSDTFCVERHRDGFHRLLDEKKVDILFANESELLALYSTDSLEEGFAAVRDLETRLHASESWATRTCSRARCSSPPASSSFISKG